MKELVTTLSRAMMLLLALFVISSNVQAQQPPCGLSVSPNGELLFESVQGALVYKVITVSNTTTEALEVHVFSSGHDTTAFGFEPRNFTLAANATKEFKVYFKPNATNIARYSATLNFTTNSGTICEDIELIGTGTLLGGGDKGLIADPYSYKFPVTEIGKESCKTFYIKNAGTTAATISEIKIDGDESFVLPSITLPMTLEAGAKYELTICYVPDGQDDMLVDGKVHINYTLAGSSDNRTLYIALASGGSNSGGDNVVVITPAQFQFPETPIGETICKEIQVINKSTMKALISSFVYEGSDQFTVTSLTALPVELNAGESLTFKVCFTPTGAANDTKGALSVNYSFDGGTTVKHATAVFFGTVPRVPSCLHSGPGSDDWYEPILVGGKDDRMLAVVNKASATVVINDIRLAGEDVKAFTVNIATPITLNSGDTVFIPFTFAPYAGQAGYLKEKYIAAIVFSVTSNDPSITCGEHEDHLWGFALGGHKDDTTKSVAIKLYPDEKQTIGLSNRGIQESYTLLFVNNLDKDVIVQSIYLKDGTKFKIDATNPATTPFTVKPDETFTVTISFSSNDGLLYKDVLIIVSDFAATPQEFDLQGINAGIASVRNSLPEGVSVAVLPNPMRASTTVDFEGVRSATIEVSDVLGSTILSTVADGDWKWNGRTASGTIAPAGTYFVRIQGTSISGEGFVTTQRVVVER